MGNCLSDPSHKPAKGSGNMPASGGQRLGSGPSAPNGASSNGGGQRLGGSAAPVQQHQPRYNDPPRTLGGGSSVGGAGAGGGGLGAGAGQGEEAQRERMIRAAEERAKASASKGVSTSNPKAGQLSAQLAAERRTQSPPAQQDQRMMDRGEWN